MNAVTNEAHISTATLTPSADAPPSRRGNPAAPKLAATAGRQRCGLRAHAAIHALRIAIERIATLSRTKLRQEEA
ncbi:hypothetical protein [Lysobacter sp. Root916]|uniref:hypothetical protein n=1 Tax=Lysobacter sp. Root916 TaxID=1736606 RepID=UPI0012FBAAA4|nr:hypothetical protein [Lysobacter sp. Root916]